MIIHSVKFEDRKSGWVLETTEFSPEITLLVGISGVGKTRILECLRILHNIAKGKVFNKYFGVSWEIRFSHNSEECIWSGSFEDPAEEEFAFALMVSEYLEEREGLPKPNLLHEELCVNGAVVAFRDNEGIYLEGQDVPRLSKKDSLLHLLADEEKIANAYRGMNSLLFVDSSDTENRQLGLMWYSDRYDRLREKYKDIESIRSADIPTFMKLALVSENSPEIFEVIKEQFMEVFPFVENLRYDFEVIGILGLHPLLLFREHGVGKEIPERDMSAGMRRTLMHISRLHLWPRDSVVLIDEFENSFGVNCIDFVADLFVDPTNSMQFIMTSHHPYVINTIPVSYWKVVVRDGCRVKTIPASEVLSSTSKHDAFIQLINLPQYTQGIAIE